MDDFLCFGDLVSLYTDEHGGYVYSNHSSSVFNEVAVSTGGQKNKPLDENVLTFEVCPPTRYQFSSHYKDLSGEPGQNEPIKTALIKNDSKDSSFQQENQAVYEAEQSFNAAEIKRQRGRPVCYGQTVQFRHKFTGKFVQVSSIVPSSIEKQNGSVSLLFGDSINGQFKILPKHKYRREGDRVRLAERLVFESIACPANYLHVSEEQYNQEKLVYNKHFELNMSALQSTFFVLRNSTCMVEGENRLKNGDIVRFFHHELQGYLVAEGYFGREILENVHLRLRPKLRERPHSLQPSSSAISYWQVEEVTSHMTDGFIIQSSTVRFLHLCTRKYLCLETAGKGADVTLTSDPQDTRAQFKLVSVDEGAGSIMFKSLYCLENVNTGHWIHATQDKYNKMQKDHSTDSRHLESLPVSKAKLRLVKASNSSAAGDISNEKLFEDLFVLEKVEEVDCKHYRFVAGMVPYLFKKHITTIQDTVVSKKIVKCFNEMIEFLSVDGKPVKNRQKLFRNLGVIERMLEFLRETIQTQNKHMSTVFTLVYDVLRAYVRGASRKNKTHIARHMSLFLGHFWYREGQVHQHAADMVNEFIRDNMEILERITNDDMTKLVDFIRLDKEYRFLELMDNFCVCQNKPVKDNQKYITNSWLKSETKNCLFFTKMGREVGRMPDDAVFVTVDNARSWLRLDTEFTLDPTKKAECLFFYHQLQTFERLCFGRNSYAIATLTSDLKYITTEQAKWCLKNDKLPEEFRALYCQLIIGLYVNTQEIQAMVHPIEELYLYRYDPSFKEEDNNNMNVDLQDLTELELESFVQGYVAMGTIQTSVKEGSNKLTAQVLSLLNHLLLLGKYPFDDNTIGHLVQLLNGLTDQPTGAMEDEIQKYRQEDRFMKSDSMSAIVEAKIQCLRVLETFFDHVLRNRLKVLCGKFRALRSSDSMASRMAEVIDPTIQSEDTSRYFSPAKDVLQALFSETAMFSGVDLPTIMVDLTRYQYDSLVTKSMETFHSYFSAIQTLLSHAARVQVLTTKRSATKCEEVRTEMVFIKDRLESKLSDSDARTIIESMEKFERFCVRKRTGTPRTMIQNFLFSQGIVTDIFIVLTSKDLQDIDANSLQTSALSLLRKLTQGNKQIQEYVFYKLDLLLTMVNHLDSVFPVVNAIFAGNTNTCKQVTDQQVTVIVKYLTSDRSRHVAVLFGILHILVKPERFGEPLRRNQNLVMRHMSEIKFKISYQFGMDEHILMNFLSEKDVGKVIYFLATVDLMATCAQNGSKENKASLRSALDVHLLLTILTKSGLSNPRMRPIVRAFTYAYCEGFFDEEDDETDMNWPTTERTMLDAFLKSVEIGLKKVCESKTVINDKFLEEMLFKSTCDYNDTDPESNVLLEYQLDAVVPFCKCFCACVPKEKVADDVQTEIRILFEKFKDFLDQQVPNVRKLPSSLREQLIDCMKSMKTFVHWEVNMDGLEKTFLATTTEETNSDDEQTINFQFQTFIRNLRLVSEGVQSQTEETWTIIKKRRLEFEALEQNNELRPMYEYFVEDADKPVPHSFEMTEKIIIELRHARSCMVHSEIVFPKPGVHQRYMQALRAILLKEITKLPTDFEVHLHSNQRQLERLRLAQITLVQYGGVECALQDLFPLLADCHLKESLHLLICLMFHGNSQSQDAISTFFLQRPDVLVIATLQNRIARFRDFAMETEPSRKLLTTKLADDVKKEVKDVQVPIQGNHFSNGDINTDTRDEVPLIELRSDGVTRLSPRRLSNKVHPLQEEKHEDEDKGGLTNVGSFNEIERETVEVTNLVLEFVTNACRNQHTQLQNYFREQHPMELSTNFVNILVEVIDTVYMRINSNIVSTVIQAFECLTQIVSGNRENKSVVLHSSVCEQSNFMLYMNNYRDCTLKQIYMLKKSVGGFWREMTEETCVVRTTGGDSTADLASTAIEYLDSEVALQVMKQASQDQSNKDGKKMQGLMKSVGFQYCLLLERKLFKFPSLGQHDILKTEEDRKIFDSYSESTRSVELLKDDTLHKVFFRVKDMNAFSGADVREKIKYEVDRSSSVEKIKDFMKWSNETTRYARNRWNKCRTPVGKILINSWFLFNFLMLMLTMAILIMIGIDYDGGESGSSRYKVERSSKVAIANWVLGGVHNLLCLAIFIHFVALHQPCAQLHGLVQLFKVSRSAMQEKSFDIRLGETADNQSVNSRLQISAYGPRMIYYVLFLLASICGTVLHGFTFALCLIQVVELNLYLKRMCRAVSYNGKYFGMLVVLGLIIMYVYAIIAFVFLREAYIKEEDGHYCNSMPQCFITILHHGLVGTAYGMFDHSTTRSFGAAVWNGVFNLSFFVLITILGLYIVLALIVDGFLHLKHKMRQAKDDFRAMCFICGRPNADFSLAPKGYGDHVTKDHNIWNYVYFFIHLDTTGSSEYSALENYVQTQLREGKYDFLPINRAICLEDIDKTRKQQFSTSRSGDRAHDEELAGPKKKLKNLPSFKERSEPQQSKDKKAGKTQRDEARGRGLDTRPKPGPSRHVDTQEEPELKPKKPGKVPREEAGVSNEGRVFEKREDVEADNFEEESNEAEPGRRGKRKRKRAGVAGVSDKQKTGDEKKDETDEAQGVNLKENEEARELQEMEDELQSLETDVPDLAEGNEDDSKAGQAENQTFPNVEDLSLSLLEKPSDEASA